MSVYVVFLAPFLNIVFFSLPQTTNAISSAPPCTLSSQSQVLVLATMALTTYFNWDTFQADVNPEASIFHEATPEELAVLDNLLDENCYLPNTFLGSSYLDPPTFLYPPQLLPNTSPYDHFEMFDQNQLLPCPKRQKYCYENQMEFPEVVFSAMPDQFKFPEGGSRNNIVEKKSSGKSVSAQSKAARERRRKITQKTQELGRLVPGGCKMNTAEMLHAAAKYVSYLKAQVGMLQLMNTLEEDKAYSSQTEDLEALLASPYVEEKLCLEEKCFVPKELVTTLANRHGLLSRPSLLKDLNQLIGTDIDEKKKEQQL